MKTPAKLQRLVLKAGALPRVEHLHRNETLFAALEWEWKPTPEGAHVFPDYAEAVAAQETHGGFPVYLSTEAPATPAPAPHRDPSAVFADLERRALA